MRHIIITIFIILGITNISARGTSSNSHNFNGIENDSLLFDGSGNFNSSTDYSSRICKVIVKYIQGTADGEVEHTEVADICSVYDTAVIVKAENLKTGDTLHMGSEIRTGDNCSLQLIFSDGSEARIGPNSKLKIWQDFCEKGTIDFYMGKMWMKIKKLLGGAKYEVHTQRDAIGVRGTEFSVEVESDLDIVTCFESSIEVKINKIKFDKGEALKQLLKDYQNGKITQQEFAQKTKELTSGIDSTTIKTSVILNTGQSCTVSGMLSDPVSIDASELHWFDDANFFKQ